MAITCNVQMFRTTPYPKKRPLLPEVNVFTSHAPLQLTFKKQTNKQTNKNKKLKLKK